MPESNHTCAALGIPYMDTQRNLICAKARESLAFQVTVNENFGLIEGQLETRSYDKDGEKRYATEVVIRPFNGSISLQDKAPSNG
jgi:hypothetical protein